MAIAIDSSTPAAVSINSTSGSTAAFNPPANSLLVVMSAGVVGAGPGKITSITDNLAGHLTYTVAKQEESTYSDFWAEIWTAPCAIAQTGMTVTPTWGANPEGMLAVAVLTGAASSQAGAATNGATANSASVSCGVTTTANGSLVIGVAGSRSSTSPTAVPGAQTNTFGSQSFVLSTVGADYAWAQTTTADTANSGTLVTLTDTITSSEWAMAAAEILAGAGAAASPLWTPQYGPAM